MLIKGLQKINILLINFIYIILLISIPIFFSIFLKTNNVFELPKLILFKILVLILIFLLTEQFVFQADKLRIYKKYKNYLIFLSLVLLYFAFHTFFISINSNLSLFGTYDRLEGTTSYIYYFLFFLASLYFFRKQKNIKLAFFVMFFSGIIASIYAIMQAWGLDPLNWSESTQLRATSTFGQPNNLGSFLLLVVPFGVYFIVIFKKWYLKILFGLGVIINLLALFYTYSTASWLGFIGGGIIVLILFLLLSNKKFRITNKKIFIILLFFIILFGVSYFTINKIKIKTLKVKIENILNWETGSTAARIDFWSAALNAIKKRPIFGYGIETQQEVLVKYYEPGWAVHSNINVRPSRAHNIILDTWLTTGIIGVILFLTIYFYILRAIIVNIKAGREKALNYCILFSLTSYFIYLQFNFWHVTAWIYFVVYSAIVINTKQKLNIQSKLQTLTPKFLILNFSFLIIIFLALSGSIVLIRGEFTKYLNDHYWWEIRRSRMHKQYFSAIKMYEFIKKNQPRHSHYDQLFSILMTDWLKEFFSLDFRSFGEEKLKEALPQMPTYTFNEKRTKAKVLVTLSDYDINYFNQAEVIYQELVKFSPNFPLIDREYAYMLAKSGQFEHAKAQYQQTLSILPSLDVKGLNRLHEARLKSEISLNYQGLIAIYEELGDIENVNKYKKLLVELETIKN